ncbi:MAG: hypothetical protein ACTSPS_02320 [Promethearchaeota archaeon]
MVDVRGKSSFAFSIRFNRKKDIPANFKTNTEQKLADIIRIIENPNEIVEEAIIQCFKLFEISEKDFKKFTSEDGEVEFRNKTRILNISYLKVKNNKSSEIIAQKVNNIDKVHAYEIEWTIFNVTWDRWSEMIRKIYEFAINQGMKKLPGLGALLGDFINKKIKKTGDQWIVNSIKSEFDDIFYSILKSNPIIEYIKYHNKGLTKSNGI